MTTVDSLSQMLSEMDSALADEIKGQNTKSGSHIASNGKLLTEQSGHYIYTFSVEKPWEQKDDTPLKIRLGSSQDIKSTLVTSVGTTITIATEEPLPSEALYQISLVDDSSQLLDRLREALKSNDEGASQLGSKSFGLKPSTSRKRPSPVSFGEKFKPDGSQEQAIQIALGSEVTYIVGPPGTGKTSTLAAIAFAHLHEGHTVLIAAQTNMAVDNAIMRLADICKDTKNSAELQSGRIVRYGEGAPQLAKRLAREYSDVHIPTIVERHAEHLHQQQGALQAWLDQVPLQLNMMNQKNVLRRESWQSDRQRLSAQCDAYKRELRSLQEREQQRITSLNTQLHDLTNKLDQAKHFANTIGQELARLAAQQVQLQTARGRHLAQMNDLSLQLATAQQMNAFMRFVKRLNLGFLSQQLANTQQQLWNDDRILADLQKYLNEGYSKRTAVQEQIERFTSAYYLVKEQRNVPSADAQRLERWQTELIRYEQYITQSDIQNKRADTDAEQECRRLTSDQERIRRQIADIDRQVADTEKNVVAEAYVVATTLCKVYMSLDLRKRRFDVVILDEVSMASLPTVYVAASHADSSVVLIGDPRQLGPISNANTSTVERWLGTDLFMFRRIILEEAARGSNNSILLNQQARMHPGISRIARQYIYKGLVTDRQIGISKDYSAVGPLPGKPLLLCDTSDASPAVMKPKGGSRINIYHALCTMEIVRQVLDSLPPPKRELQEGEFRIGLVTPYRTQAKLFNRLIQDNPDLKNMVSAGTVHRFQGLEAEVIIFDTVESTYSSPTEFISGPFGSNAMRLINVAVTRPQHKLIIVANASHIRAKFPEEAIIRLVVQEAQAAGTIMSHDLLRELMLPPPKISRNPSHYRGDESLQQENMPDTGKNDLVFFDVDKFYQRFLEDVHAAEKQITIFSPFLGISRTRVIAPELAKKCKAGVRITVITKPYEESSQIATAKEAGTLLKQSGIELRMLPKMHEKLIFIDEEIIHSGSLNVLSHRDTSEFMQRKKSPKFVEMILKQISAEQFVALVEKASVEQSKPGETPARWGPDIELSVGELPKANCKKCGKELIAKIGRYGPFYSCTGYPSCDQTEDIAERHLSNLQHFTNKRCGSCSGQTRVKVHRRDAWLGCSASTPCGYGQRIVIVKK